MAKKETAAGNVPVYVPKEYKGDDSLFVSVNGERILIKKGETVMLSPKFAEVVLNSQKQAKISAAYIEAVSNG